MGTHPVPYQSSSSGRTPDGLSPHWRGRISAVICLCITLPGVGAVRLCAQEVSKKAPSGKNAANTTNLSGRNAQIIPPLAADKLPNDPAYASSSSSDDATPYPIAEPVPGLHAQHAMIDADRQSRHDGHVVLDGNVRMTYGNYQLEAGHIDYNEDTGDLEAAGDLHLRGGSAAESIVASHGSYNLRDGTGKFYDVTGSVGMRAGSSGRVYTVASPFLFQGRIVIKNGPADFEIFDGSVTSCQLPDPDWRLASARFAVHDGKASAKGVAFRLRNIPIVYLPFVTHPVPSAGEQRQSGLLIPVVGQSSTKGFVLGEQIYLVLNRSMDLTVGSEYFSLRGWQQSATFRYKGPGLDFVHAHFSNLLDRGFIGNIQKQGNNNQVITTRGYVYQGGEDILASGRKDFSPHTRIAADAEYLSSYAYRQAFTDNFNQAVNTDIVSTLYGTHQRNGFVAALEGDRYQGLKRTLTGEQVRILHLPSLDLDALERRVGNSPLLVSATVQASALKRTQGSQVAATQLDTGFVERLEVRPEISLPFGFAGFRFRPSVALRDTFYSKQRLPVPLPGPALPVNVDKSLNRALFEGEFEVRTPVLERTFDSGAFTRLLGRNVRHTVEPEFHYRYVTGASSFSNTARFDARDVVSNTNEIEYGITQRLFLRPTRVRLCDQGELPADSGAASNAINQHPADIDDAPDLPANEADTETAREDNPTNSTPTRNAATTVAEPPTCGGTRESLRWRLVQRYFGNDNFGGNVLVLGRRNVLETTLDLSGVAFLTDRRSTSPIVSEMRLSATDHLDVEWDMNYDTRLNKFTQSNIFMNYHTGNYFGALSYARLNAPGRFQKISGDTQSTSLLSDFSQMRILLGYGAPTRPGFSIATNVGLDLQTPQPQYGALQMSYNWNCCGLSGEYRKFELGSVRNENAYRFNFTLANIGSAGTLRRAERLF